MLLSLYAIYFWFALLGIYLYGGKITTESEQVNDTEIPPLYYLLNFNDFLGSLLTLFVLMIENNWFVICNMYICVSGSSSPILFFLAFWIITACTMLNIVISFVLEIYDNVQEMVLEKN